MFFNMDISDSTAVSKWEKSWFESHRDVLHWWLNFQVLYNYLTSEEKWKWLYRNLSPFNIFSLIYLKLKNHEMLLILKNVFTIFCHMHFWGNIKTGDVTMTAEVTNHFCTSGISQWIFLSCTFCLVTFSPTVIPFALMKLYPISQFGRDVVL